MTRLVRAAGGVVQRNGPAGLEVALVHRPAYDDWTFPKGKLDGDEDEAAAAVREVEEETGLRLPLGEDLGAVTYVDGRGRPKIVRYWRIEAPDHAELMPAHEIDRAEWVALDRAAARLTYPHDRELLARVTGEAIASRPVPMYLLRHVKAGHRDRWHETEPDELRPISKAGRRQAKRLVGLFDGLPIDRLFSSPYLRCIQSLEPLGEARGLDIDLARELSEGGSPAAAEALILAAAADGPAVFSTHGDVQQGLIEELLGRGVRLDGGAGDYRKGTTWVLEVVGGKVASIRSIAPPSSDAHDR